EELEPARPHPDPRPLGIERSPAEDTALLRQPDADAHALQFGVELSREFEVLEDAMAVNGALDEPRQAPARPIGAQLERELLQGPRAKRRGPHAARERQLAPRTLELASRHRVDQTLEE